MRFAQILLDLNFYLLLKTINCLPLVAHSYDFVVMLNNHPQCSEHDSLGYIIGQNLHVFTFPYVPHFTP